MVCLGRTGLGVFPICLGGNVFGWTADEPRSGAVLDAYADAGGNFIDTSNSYGAEHGRSERIIGRWMAARGNRNQIVVATKVGGGRGPARNLRPETIQQEASASLERLQTTGSTCTMRTSTIRPRPWKSPCLACRWRRHV